jgi:hypothetical protein
MLFVDQFQDEKKVFVHQQLIPQSVFHPVEKHKIMLKIKISNKNNFKNFLFSNHQLIKEMFLLNLDYQINSMFLMFYPMNNLLMLFE